MLTSKEAEERLKKYGYNEVETKKRTIFEILIDQFNSPLVILLLVCAIGSLFLGEITDGLLIIAIVILSGLLGFFQEYKAERTAEILKEKFAKVAKVIRDGKIVEIPSKYVVPGDTLILEEGSVICADGIIIEGELEIDESPITGESVPVFKRKGDFVYSGTVVKGGYAKVEVKFTGKNTEYGKIILKSQEIESDKTVFQIHMEKMASYLTKITVGLVIISGIIFIILYQDLKLAILTAIALGVAAVPEGLPMAVTICLAVGASRMMKRNLLVKKLSKIESIGFIDILCLDKTGTITENKLRVVEVYEVDKELSKVGICTENDPIDEAIIKHFGKPNLKVKSVLPFSSERKYMMVETEEGKYYKGAPEVIFKMCDVPEDVYKKLEEMENKGLKVIAFAKDNKFLGLVGLLDPPRKGVKESIEELKKLGIEVFMITGDSPRTAISIGKMVGIESKGAITGDELENLSIEELRKKIKEGIRVFARVTPTQKLKILEVLKENNVVAMTGDGVNDVLALKRADVSIALNATDAAKESADLIILNNHISGIVDAIKEGRSIMQNIRKFFVYLISCNLAEIFIIMFGSLIKPRILLPIHILWINLITDGLPALGFSWDKSKGDKEKEPIRQFEITQILIFSTIMSIFILTFIFIFKGLEYSKFWAIVLTTIIIFELIRAFLVEYNYSTYPNKYLILFVVISFVMHLFLIYFAYGLFKLAPISCLDWIVIIGWTILMIAITIITSKSKILTNQLSRILSKAHI